MVRRMALVHGKQPVSGALGRRWPPLGRWAAGRRDHSTYMWRRGRVCAERLWGGPGRSARCPTIPHICALDAALLPNGCWAGAGLGGAVCAGRFRHRRDHGCERVVVAPWAGVVHELDPAAVAGQSGVDDAAGGRHGDGGAGALVAGQPVTLDVAEVVERFDAGRLSGLLGAVLRLTARATGASGGFGSLVRCGASTTAPLVDVSHVNVAAGGQRTNQSVVPLDSGGRICVFGTFTGSITVELVGWFSRR